MPSGSHFPADALLWVIGEWTGYEKGGGRKGQLSEYFKMAKSYIDILLPYSLRRELVEADIAILPDSLLPETLPEGVDHPMALTSIVLGLAADHATLEQDGLKPHRASEHGPLEQNEAREMALNAFAEDARLRKVGLEVHRKRLTLTFDFPQSAERRFA